MQGSETAKRSRAPKMKGGALEGERCGVCSDTASMSHFAGWQADRRAPAVWTLSHSVPSGKHEVRRETGAGDEPPDRGVPPMTAPSLCWGESVGGS